jgi:hypothetical protein
MPVQRNFEGSALFYFLPDGKNAAIVHPVTQRERMMADALTTWMGAFGAAKLDQAVRLTLADLLMCARRDCSVRCRPARELTPTLQACEAAGWLAPLEWGPRGELRTALRVPEGV